MTRRGVSGATTTSRTIRPPCAETLAGAAAGVSRPAHLGGLRAAVRLVVPPGLSGRLRAAFGAADEVVVAPVFRSSLPEPERLSVPDWSTMCGRGRRARGCCRGLDDIVATLAEERDGDLVVVMSNGGFGGIHRKLLEALGA